ncbi:N(5)-(carboxyethyl)ornithine synthase [Winogradskyella alexanderae]|uniref:N(5)-(Carboxyethyl)ornithine synthase n=1 Tax=Winogradskyella alexanderae TaxID=2877123 RepID=A0ABS7XU75_9FLAO|nr:N(5)-(carboxyethyl)ornithine synthase [Winogradskyella alexanderae]MCA0132983.1 N(5)-(carboxyethyl)ornithine synthase [Winogradskyella alexanderae]
MSLLTVGVFGTSRKKQEKRVPIHPDQLDWIDQEVRDHLFFEEGYGLPFGMNDSALTELSAGVLSRAELFQHCKVALLAKPVQEDFDEMKEGTIHWGWPHCVQQRLITQSAIDKKLTLIAWEAMHRWTAHGDWQMHIFQHNNEIAGYAGVHHAMNLMGIDGNYGPNRKAVVISFGSVSRGAIRALQARGIQDITVLTQRHYFLVADQMAGVNYYQIDEDEKGNLIALRPDNQSHPFIEELIDADIIVNGMLQDTDNPLMFVSEDQNNRLKPGCLIIDISCDEGMGFSFAKPTNFERPIFKVGTLFYYAVDHTPSYLWNAASWEISSNLIPYLPIIIGGPEKWKGSETIRRAIEIKDGIIKNPKITSFQNRSSEYPHLEISAST